VESEYYSYNRRSVGKVFGFIKKCIVLSTIQSVSSLSGSQNSRLKYINYAINELRENYYLFKPQLLYHPDINPYKSRVEFIAQEILCQLIRSYTELSKGKITLDALKQSVKYIAEQLKEKRELLVATYIAGALLLRWYFFDSYREYITMLRNAMDNCNKKMEDVIIELKQLYKIWLENIIDILKIKKTIDKEILDEYKALQEEI